MPIVEIDVTSLEIHHSFLMDAFRMDFNVILWTEDLKTAVVKDLERLYGVDYHNNGYHEPLENLGLSVNQIQVRFWVQLKLCRNNSGTRQLNEYREK